MFLQLIVHSYSDDFAEVAGHGTLPDSDNLEFYISTRYGPDLERITDELHEDPKLSVNTAMGIVADVVTCNAPNFSEELNLIETVFSWIILEFCTHIALSMCTRICYCQIFC